MIIDKRERDGLLTIKIPFNVLYVKEKYFLDELYRSIHDICNKYEAVHDNVISLEIDNYE